VGTWWPIKEGKFLLLSYINPGLKTSPFLAGLQVGLICGSFSFETRTIIFMEIVAPVVTFFVEIE
jgi:hypothetical protein